MAWRASILLFCGLLGFPGLLSAQWHQDTTLPFTITSIRWLEEEGRIVNAGPAFRSGVLGGPQRILYRNWSVTRWLSSTLPSDWTDGSVVDFTFEDTLVGYAAIYGAQSSYYTLAGVSGILKTTDGGASWNFLTMVPAEVRGLYYDKQNSKLFASSGGVDDIGGFPGPGAWVSGDHGATWNRINIPTFPSLDSECYYTGFASWNGTDIVLATEGAPNPCTNAGFPPQNPFWLVSHDGGATWKIALMSLSCWQPVALDGTQTFYAECEGYLYRSDDNGRTFRSIPPPNNYSDSGSTMAGNPCGIVASGSSSVDPIYSSDDGQSWVSLSGLSASPTLRYYVGRDSIWAASGGTLEAIKRPTPVPVHHYPIGGVNFAYSGCFESDTVVRLYGCATCGTDTLISDTIQFVSGGANFSIPSPLTTPRVLCGPDSVRVRYSPQLTPPDSALLLLVTSIGGVRRVDTVALSGNGMPAGLTFDFPSNRIIDFNLATCQASDTCITIFNTTCSDIIVTSVKVASGSGGAVIQVSAPMTPFVITGKGGTQRICIHAQASTPGSYSSTITITPDSAGTPVTFAVAAFVHGSGIGPFGTGLSVKMNYPCFRPSSRDTAMYCFNTGCEAMWIQSVSMANPTDTNIIIDSVGGLLKNGPIELFPADTAAGPYFLAVHVRLNARQPGTYRDSLVWHYRLADGFDSVAVIPITIQVLHKVDPTPLSLTGRSKDFGCVRTCDSAYVTFRDSIGNPCRFPDTVRTIYTYLAGGGPGFNYRIVDGPTVGQVIPGGSVDSIVVAWPFGLATSPVGGWIRVTYGSGSDSAMVTYSFTGLVCPCSDALVSTEASTSPKVNVHGDELAIELPSGWASTYLTLTDLLGRTTLATTVTATGALDVSRLASGVYYYRLRSASQVASGQIVLTR